MGAIAKSHKGTTLSRQWLPRWLPPDTFGLDADRARRLGAGLEQQIERFRGTNGELVSVRGVENGEFSLKMAGPCRALSRVRPRLCDHTAHRSQGKTVDGVILPADAMKQELFSVRASRERSEIAIVTGDRNQLRESLGISSARPSAMELAREQSGSRALGQVIQHTPTPQIGPPALRHEVSVGHDIGL